MAANPVLGAGNSTALNGLIGPDAPTAGGQAGDGSPANVDAAQSERIPLR
jgi:hypothetical protein